jgi:hypothetical protein
MTSLTMHAVLWDSYIYTVILNMTAICSMQNRSQDTLWMFSAKVEWQYELKHTSQPSIAIFCSYL